MIQNLVIVESPAKAKTIEKFLGKDFIVKSSFGHIRDLSKKNYGIDLNNDYKPEYIIPDDKKQVVKELKSLAKEAQVVWLASDEDREGEAIAWHLSQVLKLDPQKTKRIVFHEITKGAILEAIEDPRNIDQNLVDAQQARRILDRLVGFELSPILWRKVKPSLSAGRVQSVAVRILVEREREIKNFKSAPYYRLLGKFQTNSKQELGAELNTRFDSEKQVLEFLNQCKESDFVINSIEQKPGKKSPSPPFTTSTLQQDASRKLGFSVSQTMAVAQKLYEGGKITYMRTDSVNLSGSALNKAKETINDLYGGNYHKLRNYKTKSKGAQEAHEAIRPTSIEKQSISGSNQEQRLYELIWKRTIASQMSDAKLEKTNISIDISKSKHKFIATGEVLTFDGFLKVYIESTDDQSEETKAGLLPKVKQGEQLAKNEIVGTERYSHYPARYTEASLVRKLEELGIGRPSTYAPTITTIQNRGYVVKEDRQGTERKYSVIVLNNQGIEKNEKVEVFGSEKGKLFPNDIGMVVNDFLIDHFDKIVNFNFTASVEEEFDQIAQGKLKWTKMIDKFYNPFHEKVEDTLEHSERSVGERILGDDPESGRQVSVKIGPYGPMAQIGVKEEEEKPKFARLIKGQSIESISLKEALELFKLPRDLGKYENKVVVVGIGRFGPFVRHDNKFVSLKKGIDDPYKIELNRAIELIEEKREKDKQKYIKSFDEEPELQILNGRWGPYISFKKKNYKIPKDQDPKELKLDDCKKIISETDSKKAGDKKATKTKKKS